MTAWEPYKGDGRCDQCKQAATWAYVRLDKTGTFAHTLLKLACSEAHK